MASEPNGPKRIFVASPSDARLERESMPSIVNELNHTLRALVPQESTSLELVRWETHTYPAMGRPQGVINDQIGEFDIFVGILWQRFGTPTGQAGSGTEEEFRRAYAQWAEHGRPQILFYFNVAEIAPPRTTEAVQQLASVVQFRQELAEKGLIWEYEGAQQFSDTVRPHLTAVVGQLLRASEQHQTPVDVVNQNRPTPASIGQRLSGELVRIVDLDQEDAYRDYRDQLIGRTGKLRGPMPSPEADGWYSGLMDLDQPILGFASAFQFFKVRVERQ